MRFFGNVISLTTLATIALQLSSITADGATIIIGNDTKQNMNIRWSDGVCYVPIMDAHVGDTLVFTFGGHNVYQMNTRASYDACDFTEAMLMASASESPFSYTITDGEEEKDLYFACAVGNHCGGGMQKIRVRVLSSEAAIKTQEHKPLSQIVLGLSKTECDKIQVTGELGDVDTSNSFQSSCSEPVVKTDVNADDGREWMFSSCLSNPMTLTPGGVINQAMVLHYPFPTDHRVLLGTRVWEFVEGDPNNGSVGTTPVNVNQLYVHHITGGLVVGNGAQNIRDKLEDGEFPAPYGKLSGDFDNIMLFHIIDLRTVGQEWLLECVECRCKDAEGNYLEIGGAGEGNVAGLGGGISCCSNCTTLTSPTIDYRLRYNVTFMDIPEDEYVEPIRMMTTDIASVVGKKIEFDVPHFTNLPEEHILLEDPQIQVLRRTGIIRDMFYIGNSYERRYDGPDTLKIHRCTGHMHIGAIEQRIENAVTGEIICTSKATYGTDPMSDLGFITGMGVTNFNPPILLSADQSIRVVTLYNASTVHTGVMGLLQVLFSDGNVQVKKEETPLTVEFCESSTCNASKLPIIEKLQETCTDDIQKSLLCTSFGVCSCDMYLGLPNVIDGCDGYLLTKTGVTYPTTQFCAKTCNCTVGEKVIETELQNSIKSVCDYASKDCYEYLANLYSCADEKDGIDSMETDVRDLVVRKGRLIALDGSKLGHPALHQLESILYDGSERVIPVCGNNEKPQDEVGDKGSGDKVIVVDEEYPDAPDSTTSFGVRGEPTRLYFLDLVLVALFFS